MISRGIHNTDSPPRKTELHWKSEYDVEYLNICDLILIFMAISPGTDLFERSFAKLSKMC